MFQSIKNLFRISQLILVTLFKGIPIYILLSWYYKKTNNLKYSNSLSVLGRKLSTILQYCGPTFIKLGQVFSTRPDLIGEIIAFELSHLQDKLSPFPFKHVQKQIKNDFGNIILNIFEEFSEIPVAAASIAQVHKAKLKTGEIVAVKVLRPNIEQNFNSDIQLFNQLIKFSEILLGRKIKRLNLFEVLSTLIECVSFELDLRCEASAADEINFNTKKDSHIKVPMIYWPLVSKNVLTSEWIDGIPIDDYEALIIQGHDLHKLALNLTVCFFNQSFRDGFFHADLHPGNIFVDNKGNIVLVDFGIVGLLNKQDRIYIAQIIYGFIKRDYQRVADIHFEAGYVPKNKDPKLFALACRAIGEPIIGLPANKISVGQLLKQLFAVTKQFDMPTQPQLLLLQKTMVTIEGIGQVIYPEVNMWQLADPWIKKWADENFGLKVKIKEICKNSNMILSSLPQLYKESIEAINLVKAANSKKLQFYERAHASSKPYKYYAISFLAGIATLSLIQLLIN